MNHSGTMRIAIVEDDPVLLEHLRLLLNGEPGVTSVDAFRSAEEVLPEISSMAPDVMLIDLGLPGMSGTELIRKIRGILPETSLMVHTVFEDRENVFSAIKAGAMGYILKGSSPREILEALRELFNGGAPMSPKIARKVISEFQDNRSGEEFLLSPREKDIVREIERGLSYKEIADKFRISPHTVHSHIKNIYEKLHAKNRQEVLTLARRKGII